MASLMFFDAPERERNRLLCKGGASILGVYRAGTGHKEGKGGSHRILVRTLGKKKRFVVNPSKGGGSARPANKKKKGRQEEGSKKKSRA